VVVEVVLDVGSLPKARAKAYWEPSAEDSVLGSVQVIHSYWKIVHNPVHAVLVVYRFYEGVAVLLGEFNYACHFTGLGNSDVQLKIQQSSTSNQTYAVRGIPYLIHGVFNIISRDSLADILSVMNTVGVS
jgi:hypothetical protein